MTDEEKGRLTALEAVLQGTLDQMRADGVMTCEAVFGALGRAMLILDEAEGFGLTRLARAHAEATLKRFAYVARAPGYSAQH